MTNNPKDIIKEFDELIKNETDFLHTDGDMLILEENEKDIETIKQFLLKALTQARADERKKVGKELLGYFLGENNKKVELAIREITGEKL